MTRLASPDDVGEGEETYAGVTGERTLAIDEHALLVRTVPIDAESRRASDHRLGGLSGVLSGLLIGAARATDCPQAPLISTEAVLDIDLVSDADLSPEYPAGTSLADIVRADVDPYVLNESAEERFVYLASATSAAPSLRDLVATVPPAPLRLALRLLTPLDGTHTHRFSVTYSLANGDVFVATSPPVTLSPAVL